MTYSEKYVEYLASPEWRVRRALALSRAHYQCERGCGEPATEVNHKTYTRLGRENPSDLEALCHHCHVVADYERQTDGTPEQRKDRWNARLQGWAEKVYGDNEFYWPDNVEEKFEEWLDSREGVYGEW